MKKLVTILMVTLLMVSFASAAFATTDMDVIENAEMIAELGNEAINWKIEEAVESSEVIVEAYNEGSISLEEKEAQLEVLILTLIDETNAISANTRSEIAELGLYAICTWQEVLIDGEVVMIDPIRIVGS